MTKIFLAVLITLGAAAPAFAQAGRPAAIGGKTQPATKYWLSAGLTTLAYGAKAGEAKMVPGQH